MVTIEEKIKLFTELIYQKLEKENQEEINKFNEMYSNILNQKKKEFEDYINNLKEEKIRRLKDDTQKIISKAKYDQKKIVLRKRQEIFESFINDIKIKLKDFVSTENYKKWVNKSFDDAIKNIFDNEFSITTTGQTLNILKDKIDGLKINIIIDESLIGGFILEDNNKVRLDYSINSIVEGNRERIGLILYSGL